MFESNTVTKASQSLGHGLATVTAILAERAQTPLQLVSAAFNSFSRRLPPSIQINHLFSQRQVCMKGLDRDQNRRVTMPHKNGKCLVPSLCKVVGPVPVRERLGVNIPHRWWKRRCRTSQTYRERTVIWTMNAAV